MDLTVFMVESVQSSRSGVPTGLGRVGEARATWYRESAPYACAGVNMGGVRFRPACVAPSEPSSHFVLGRADFQSPRSNAAHR
jgi:hypothetical protein